MLFITHSHSNENNNWYKKSELIKKILWGVCYISFNCGVRKWCNTYNEMNSHYMYISCTHPLYVINSIICRNMITMFVKWDMERHVAQHHGIVYLSLQSRLKDLLSFRLHPLLNKILSHSTGKQCIPSNFNYTT